MSKEERLEELAYELLTYKLGLKEMVIEGREESKPSSH